MEEEENTAGVSEDSAQHPYDVSSGESSREIQNQIQPTEGSTSGSPWEQVPSSHRYTGRGTVHQNQHQRPRQRRRKRKIVNNENSSSEDEDGETKMNWVKTIVSMMFVIQRRRVLDMIQSAYQNTLANVIASVFFHSMVALLTYFTFLVPPRGFPLLFSTGCLLIIDLLISNRYPLLNIWSMRGTKICFIYLVTLCINLYSLTTLIESMKSENPNWVADFIYNRDIDWAHPTKFYRKHVIRVAESIHVINYYTILYSLKAALIWIEEQGSMYGRTWHNEKLINMSFVLPIFVQRILDVIFKAALPAATVEYATLSVIFFFVLYQLVKTNWPMSVITERKCYTSCFFVVLFICPFIVYCNSEYPASERAEMFNESFSATASELEQFYSESQQLIYSGNLTLNWLAQLTLKPHQCIPRNLYDGALMSSRMMFKDLNTTVANTSAKLDQLPSEGFISGSFLRAAWSCPLTRMEFQLADLMVRVTSYMHRLHQVDTTSTSASDDCTLL